MRSLFIYVFLIISQAAYSASCDCDVMVLSPMTGSHQMPATNLKVYQLENYASISPVAQNKCRISCQKKYEEDMSPERIKALLLVYSQRLIDEKLVGYNCTGLTTLQYPVLVKARLGHMSLGNVYQSLEVVTHEEICF